MLLDFQTHRWECISLSSEVGCEGEPPGMYPRKVPGLAGMETTSGEDVVSCGGVLTKYPSELEMLRGWRFTLPGQNPQS